MKNLVKIANCKSSQKTKQMRQGNWSENKSTALTSKPVLGHHLKYLGLNWSQLCQRVGAEKGN